MSDPTTTVGVPREVKTDEHRVAITPDGVHEMVNHGVAVVVESGAGDDSSISDDDYRQVGAEIVADAESVWGRVRIVLKVKEPQASELEYLRPDLTLFTYLHLAAYPAVAEALLAAGTTGIAYETVQLAVGSASVARADERGRGPHGTTGRCALPRAPSGRPRDPDGRRARRASRARRRARRGQRRLERGMDRAGHGGGGPAPRPEPRSSALGRPDPQGPDHDAGEQPARPWPAPSPTPTS